MTFEFLNLEFVRNVSHELKTPLGNIAGYAQLLLSGDCDEQTQRNYAETIYAEAVRTLEFSTHMLGLCRLSSTSRVEKKDVYSLGSQVREIILAMQETWTKKNVNMQVDLDDAEIVNNEYLTYHVFSNLISNAVKYVDDGGTVSVTLRVNDKVRFSISNTGRGISGEDIPHIFDRFFVADKVSPNRGTGLGLCIAKKITDALGGVIHVESTPGELTTFEVEL